MRCDEDTVDYAPPKPDTVAELIKAAKAVTDSWLPGKPTELALIAKLLLATDAAEKARTK